MGELLVFLCFEKLCYDYFLDSSGLGLSFLITYCFCYCYTKGFLIAGLERNSITFFFYSTLFKFKLTTLVLGEVDFLALLVEFIRSD